MIEALQFSKLASGLLRNLQEVSESTEEDDAVHAQSIQLILESYERVEYLISQRKLPDETPADTEHLDDSDDSVN